MTDVQLFVHVVEKCFVKEEVITQVLMHLMVQRNDTDINDEKCSVSALYAWPCHKMLNECVREDLDLQ